MVSPKVLFYALILIIFGYFFPLLIGTGAVELDCDQWTDGYLSNIAKIIGGVFLRTWVQAASALSNVGMFVDETNSDCFQLLGMAERSMLPEVFARRSHHRITTIGILFSASGVILLCFLSFEEIVAAEDFLYCFGILMEFKAFVKVRNKYLSAYWPYKVPVGTVGAVLMCVPPTLLVLVVLVLASPKVTAFSLLVLLVGLVMQSCLSYSERKRWFRFSRSPDLPDLHSLNLENPEI